MPTSTRPSPTCAAAAPTNASAPPSTMRPKPCREPAHEPHPEPPPFSAHRRCARWRPAGGLQRPTPGRGRHLRPVDGQVALNAWVKITPDDRVIVAAPRSEMGQGVHTGLAQLLADELDARWDQVSVEAAPLARVYANTALLLNVSPLLPDDDGLLARLTRASLQTVGYALALQVTGGSSSIRDAWEPLRLAGATARQQLLAAAAARLQVPPAELTVQDGQVRHAASGRTLRFGELAQAAAALPAPTDVSLKPASAHRLIGQPVPRTDIPVKVNGQARFGIDTRLPGLLYAAIRQCPVFGGHLRPFDLQAARALPGVKDVITLNEQAVVVLAGNTWTAQQAVNALPLQWEEGPHAQLD